MLEYEQVGSLEWGINMLLKSLDPVDKQLIDGLSVVTVLGTLTSMLPSIAAVFTIVWTGIRIYETETVQKFLKRGGTDV